MKILKIGIYNLNSLQLKTEIDFTKTPISDTGLFAITGDTGSGKTTILDAITLALYGKIHRNKDVKEIMSYGQAECYAVVEFDCKNTIYRSKWSLWRARGKATGAFQAPSRELAVFSSDLDDFKILATKIKEVDNQIEAITGLDYNRFTRSVLLSQGDFAAFLNASEKDRSDLLERITGTEIYSEISIAAYQKYKEETEKVKQLQLQQNALQLLPKEEVQNLKNHKKELTENSNSTKTKIDTFRQSIAWYKNIEKLELQKETTQKQFQNWQREMEVSKANFALLEKHELALPFQQLLTQFQDAQIQNQSITTEITQLSAQTPQLQEQEEKTKKALLDLENQLKSTKKELSESEKIFQQVQKIDVILEEKTIPFEAEKKELEELQTEQKSLTKNLAQQQEEIEKKEQNLRSHTSWLEENKLLVAYKDLAPKIDLERNQLREIYKEKDSHNKELQKLEKSLQKSQKDKEIVAKELHQLESRKKQLIADFQSLAPENFGLTRTELLQKLNDEIDELDDESKHLKDLKELTKDYMRLLQQHQEQTESLENLQQEEIILGKNILNSTEILDAISERVAFKKEILDQQKLIANYERDRKNLAEGEQCPLCFSTQHPFREVQLKPYVDQAQTEYDDVLAQQDTLKENHVQLIAQFRDLMSRIQHIKGDENQNLEGQLDALLGQINQLEAKMSAFAPEIKAEHYEITKDAILLQKISTFELEISQKRAARQQLILIDKTLENQEEKSIQAQNNVKELEFAIRSQKENQTRLQKEIKNLNSEFEQNTQSLNQHLHQLGYAFEKIEKAGEMFNTLKEKGNLYEEKNTAAQELKQVLALQKQAQDAKNKQLQKLNKEIKKTEKQVQKTQVEIQKLHEKRTTLFGNKNVEEERSTLTKSLQNNEVKINLQRAKSEQSTINLQSHLARLKEQEKQSKKIKQLLDKSSSKLSQKLEKSLFASIGDLSKALLDAKQVDNIQSQRKELEKQAIELQQQQRNIEAQLSKEKAALTPEFSQAEINLKLAESEQIYQNIQQEFGSLQEKIQQDTQRKKEAKDLLKTIESQEIELSRWSKLNDLIGQADGQKFRKFAQGLTLQNLVIYANQHLQRLHGRYRISKDHEQDLHLDIIDAYQADNRRSMQTLSGGESFLVSLALALALSDMASSKTNIQSLFIDEGFGTLDEQTLDLAITTLENLQAQGKTIGVISHVKALKERIGTQIKVHKSGSGVSSIEVVG